MSIFLLTISRLNQVQCKVAISILVNGASITPVAQYFYVHSNTISRLQTCFYHSVIVCNRQRSGQPLVTSPAEYRYDHPLHSIKIVSVMLPWYREISLGRDVLLDKLFGTDYVRSTQCPPVVRLVPRPHHRQARLQLARRGILRPLQR